MTNTQSKDATRSSRALGDPLVLALSVGFILGFIALSLYDIDMVAESISAGFAWTAKTLGVISNCCCC